MPLFFSRSRQFISYTPMGIFVLLSGLVFFCAAPALTAEASSSDPAKRQELEQQLDHLQKEADGLDASIKQTKGEAQSLAHAKQTLDIETRRREIEIKRLTLSIAKTAIEIRNKQATIDLLSRKLDKSQDALSASILLLYTYDQENILTALLRYITLSDFFSSLNALERVQANVQNKIKDFRTDRDLRQKEQDDLGDSQKEQEDLKALQEVERRFLAQKKQEKDQLLRLTKGKEALFQQILKSKQRDIATLKTQLYYLEQTGIMAEDAVRLADLAAKRTGIRTAFLLALLEVETGKQFEDGVISVGTNLGTGNWKKDMYECYRNLGKPRTAEAEKAAFFRISSSLGLDPDKMPVSRKPSYGCGGAMGPAQFLPSSWLHFSDDVARLTGHNPANPWSPEDAFTAAAVFLAQAGADSKTEAGEIAAAKTYISGSSSCRKAICRYYSSRILALSQEIDKVF